MRQHGVSVPACTRFVAAQIAPRPPAVACRATSGFDVAAVVADRRKLGRQPQPVRRFQQRRPDAANLANGVVSPPIRACNAASGQRPSTSAQQSGRSCLVTMPPGMAAGGPAASAGSDACCEDRGFRAGMRASHAAQEVPCWEHRDWRRRTVDAASSMPAHRVPTTMSKPAGASKRHARRPWDTAQLIWPLSGKGPGAPDRRAVRSNSASARLPTRSSGPGWRSLPVGGKANRVKFTLVSSGQAEAARVIGLYSMRLDSERRAGRTASSAPVHWSRMKRVFVRAHLGDQL